MAPYFPEKDNLSEPLGEAWLTGMDCRIANGPFAGQRLGDAWHLMPTEWRGTTLAKYAEFPVLVKLIFPTDKLSIQVHPDDAYAAAHEQAAGGRGKTEMWHIVDAEPGAELLFGLKPGITREQFQAAIKANTLEDLLVHQPVLVGESYFVPPGTQHAMGPGMVVCEVQEYSDLTYRVYDFGRVDSSGKARELHIDKALEVTRFEGTAAGKIEPLRLHSPDANKQLLVACHFFAVERWVAQKTTLLESDPTHFQLLVILKGEGGFHDSEYSFRYKPGQTWFAPASLPVYALQPDTETNLIRVFVPDPAVLRRQLESLGFEKENIDRVLVG